MTAPPNGDLFQEVDENNLTVLAEDFRVPCSG